MIGLGYVGLPTAAIFATHGTEVIGVDVNELKVRSVNNGKAPIIEPGLDKLVNNAVSKGKLVAKTKPTHADAFIIAVPTPLLSNRKPNLKYVKAAIHSIRTLIKKGNLIILESTSPVGTTEQICKWLAASRKDLTFPHSHGNKADINVAHSPERVLPGNVLFEIMQNDRVIGGVSKHCAEQTKNLYKLILKGRHHITDARTAELVKLMENAYRDTNIAFANELSLICNKLKIDCWEAIELANHHPRVNILKPGPGVGGHCIAIDPWFIVDSAPKLTPLIQAARRVNENKPKLILRQIVKIVKKSKNPVISCLGLAYKSNIDDLRESPAINITLALAKEKNCTILVVEPHIKKLPNNFIKYTNIQLVNLDEALKKSQIIVLLTDHKQFHNINRKRILGKQIFDTRGIWGIKPD